MSCPSPFPCHLSSLCSSHHTPGQHQLKGSRQAAGLPKSSCLQGVDLKHPCLSPPLSLCIFRHSGKRRQHVHTGCPYLEEPGTLDTTSRCKGSPTIDSKPNFHIELKLKWCLKCSARDRNLQSVAQAVGVKLTVRPSLEGGPECNSRPGPTLGPQVLSRMRVFSPGLATQPCSPGGALFFPSLQSLPQTTSWTLESLRHGQ